MSNTTDRIDNAVHTDGSGLPNEISTLVSSIDLQGANGVISGTVVANGSNQPEVNGLAIGANGNNTTKGFNNFNQSFTNQAYTTALPDGDSWLYSDNTGTLGVTQYEPQFNGKFSDNGADNSSTIDSVPLMTGYTSPSGEVIYSTDRTGQEAYRVFENSLIEGWSPTSGTTTGYVGYKYPSPKSVNKYTVQARSGGGFSASRNPRDWTFEASNTGAWSGEEIVLDTVTNETGWSDSEKRIFTFENSVVYLYYRMNVSANNGNATFLTVGELELIETPSLTLSDYYDLSTNEWKNSSDVVYANGRSYLAKVNSGAQSTIEIDQLDYTLLGALKPSLYSHQTYTNVFSTTSTSYIDIPSFSVSFTPKSKESKILILGSVNYSSSTTTNNVFFRLMRDTVSIGNGTNDICFGGRLGTTNGVQTGSINYIDSPNTITQVTYKFQIRVDGGTGRVNERGSTGSDYSSHITVLELGV